MKKSLAIILVISLILIGYSLFVINELKVVNAYGVIKTKNVYNCVINFPTYINKVYVQSGQQVKQNERLISLDLRDYRALLQNKEQELKLVESSIQKEQAEVYQFNNELQNGLITLNNSRKELQDREKLFLQGAISQYELDDFKKTVRLNQKAVDDARISLDAIIKGNSGFVEKKEKIKKVKMEIDILKSNLCNSFVRNGEIVCPFVNGVINEICCNPGDRISDDNSEGEKVISILDLNSKYIEVLVAENQIKNVKINAQVNFTPLTNQYQHYKGKVIKISNIAVSKNGETFFPVDVAIGQAKLFRPYQNVDVKIYKSKL